MKRRSPLILAFLILGASLSVFWDTIYETLTGNYARSRFGKITASSVILREEPSTHSYRIRTLRQGTIVRIVGETEVSDSTANSVGSKWFKVRTRSKHEGWCFGRLLGLYPEDAARAEIHRDEAAFEDRLREAIDSAVKEKVRILNPASDVTDVRLINPIERISSASFNSRVCALTKGQILGWTKYRVDLDVNLDLQIDANSLQDSRIRVRAVEVVSDEKLSGPAPSEVADAFLQITKLFGAL